MARPAGYCRVTLLIALAAGCGKQSDLDVTWIGTSTESYRGIPVNGTRGDDPVFAVFQSGPLPQTVSSFGSRRAMTAGARGLTCPNGEEVELPTASQLIEIVNGRLHESDRLVALGEFRAFLESKPEAFAVERLLQFVDARRKGRAGPR